MKTAFVTGGSRGIGKAITERLYTDGYDVICPSKKKCNLETGENVEEFLNSINKPVNLLVNCAGRSYKKPFTELEKEEFSNIININMIYPMLLCRIFLSVMPKGSSIINITSESAKFGGNDISVYSASKAAMNIFTTALAREVAKDGIRVNAVSPGVIDTEMTKDFLNIEFLPMKRKGKPEEVANVVSWLASEEASYISGAIISVNGGR